ncbi:PilZ domain-containing protein [Enhygromyxa salina]|uniref:PilZ domain protein n=1 Tax=Enhygromyxa salina TaxID=215803 RepID=A0A2S9YYG0_9BACT|nr:PilZ domain-containing protein [Enhygromyxa salina]PRQ10099.1 PilZ domain protein [Enhygromyxa salina]
MNSEDERRREERVALHSVGVVDLGDHTVACQTLDVSRTGMAVLAAAAAPTCAVQVRFKLGNSDAAWTDVEAMVVHSHPLGDGQTHVWGLKLHPMDLGTRTRVRGYIAAKRAAAVRQRN